MARFKTFDSTGIAPNGRLYAGDLNAIQDFLAKASDFAQTVDVGTLRVGDSSIQLLKFGTGEARISAALRTDGPVRALGGLFGGTFTTAQRDAIPLGSRPQGLMIFNSTTSRIEFNIGSDATPSWAGANDPIPGVMWPWPYSENGVPSGWAIAYGQSVTKVANPVLWARANADGFPHGGDANNVTLPDMRGRHPVGKDNMGGAAANRIGVGNAGQTLGGIHGEENHQLLTTELAQHGHTVNSHSHTVNSHSHGGATGPQNADHVHGTNAIDKLSGAGWASGGQYNSQVLLADGSSGVDYAFNTGGVSAGHAHGITAESPGTDPQSPGTSNAGSNTPHNNLQPGMITNWIIKLG
jgi:microcystin-dependent protein